ncbi:MAG: hypothetical protein EOO73_08555 [Myxococcales bacterium]|nr:MAG: hypothetical protein EOO73_08555 [Myxococcales bacterium]
MMRAGSVSGRVTVALGALAFSLLAVACDEDGKTAPQRCSTLPEPFDIQKTPAPEDDNRSLNVGSGGEGALPNCVTEVGHAVSSFSDGLGGEASSPGSSGSGGSGGSSSGGEAGTAGSADAGAGGA